MTRNRKDAVIGTTGLLFGPFALMTSLLLLEVWLNRAGMRLCILSLLALPGSVMVGLWFLWRLPLRRMVRVCAAPVYTMALVYLLFVYLLVFSGQVLGNWL